MRKAVEHLAGPAVALLVILAFASGAMGTPFSGRSKDGDGPKKRCVAVSASIGTNRVREGGATVRVSGPVPLRRRGVIYLSLSFLRTAPPIQTTWNAHTRRITIAAGPLRLQTVVGRRSYTLNGRAGQLAGPVITVGGQPMLPAYSVLRALGIESTQNNTATFLLIVPTCAIGTPQETPYLELLASRLPRPPQTRGERIGVVGSVLAVSKTQLTLREIPIVPALGGGSKGLFSQQHPAYSTGGATVRVKLSAATRAASPTPILQLPHGTPVIVAGHIAHRHLVADAVVDLASPPASPGAAPFSTVDGTAGSHISDPSTTAPRSDVFSTRGAYVDAAAVSADAASSTEAVFGGQYGLPGVNWSSPLDAVTVGCATLAVQASVDAGAGETWDWPMTFAASSNPSPLIPEQAGAQVALGVEAASPAGYSFSGTTGIAAGVDLTLTLNNCLGVSYKIDLGGPSFGVALANTTDAPAPLYGDLPVSVPSTACASVDLWDLGSALNLSNALSKWGFTNLGLGICSALTIHPAALAANVAIDGLRGASGGNFALANSNSPAISPLIFTGTPTPGSGPVTVGLSQLAYTPVVDAGFGVDVTLVNQSFGPWDVAMPSSGLDNAIAEPPTTSPGALMLPVLPACGTTNGPAQLHLGTPTTSGLKATVNGVVIVTPGSALTGIEWNWGDGTDLTGCDYFPESHTYRQAGQYTVTVTTTGTLGFRLSASESVTVR